MEKEHNQPVELNIQIRRGPAILFAVALFAAILLIALALNNHGTLAQVEAPTAGESGLRKYYITETSYTGWNALYACAEGYHMASLWELYDLSNLEFVSELSFSTSDDRGHGPPSHNGAIGWVRTGFDPETGAAGPVPGEANCNAWTSNNASDYGTTVKLNYNWTYGFKAWFAVTYTCDQAMLVWCVED